MRRYHQTRFQYFIATAERHRLRDKVRASTAGIPVNEQPASGDEGH